jgi:GNAT superfamily N-acetyltransferase
MIIRKGTSNDILKVSRLWLQMAQELAPKETPNVEWWRKISAGMMKNGGYHIFLAEDGGKIVGFLDFFLFPEPLTGKLHMVGQHFFVLPEHRNNAVSGKIYRESLKFGKASGAKVAELFCFDNEKDMWMKKGYKPVRSMVRRTLYV